MLIVYNKVRANKLIENISHDHGGDTHRNIKRCGATGKCL